MEVIGAAVDQTEGFLLWNTKLQDDGTFHHSYTVKHVAFRMSGSYLLHSQSLNR